MIIDGFTNMMINMMIFTIMVLVMEQFQSFKKKNYTPTAWININKDGIKLFSLGIIIALFYKFVVGLIGTINGAMILTISQSGVIKSLIYTLASSLGFLGVALFEEGLFRGYIMQVIFRRSPILLAIVIQAVGFGLIHYNNYSNQPYVWLNILNAILIGLIFGIIVVKTESLMLVIGAHLMYDVAEQILFVNNSYKFDRAIYFQNSNHLITNIIGSLLYVDFIELILLSIITISLGFLFRKDILYKSSNNKCLFQ